MVEVNNLNVNIEGFEAVKNLSFKIEQGEILGVVGESGSGKTMTSLAISGLMPITGAVSGEVVFDGINLMKLKSSKRRKYNGKHISVIFQEPMTSLNPLVKVGKQIEEVLLLHENLSKTERNERIIKILNEVEINEPQKVCHKYPHELSGGMRQRIVIAMASILNPALIIADEPTTSLDVNTSDAILRLISKINKKHNNSVLFISHDLKVIRKICSRVLVMKDGEIVEAGSTKEIFEAPKQDYTKKLLECAYLDKKLPVCLSENKVLEVKNVTLYYNEREKSLLGKKYKNEILNNINFSVNEGEIVGIMGDSGRGKTTLAKALLGIHKGYTGEIIHYTKQPQMVFQDPYSSLNPMMKIGQILAEPLKAAGGYSKVQIKEKVMETLIKVGLSPEFYDRYPDELSGGQRQRVSIAAAIINQCKFIIADEPCSALDVTVQKQILELFLKLQKEMNLAILLISHDKEVVEAVCDKVIRL